MLKKIKEILYFKKINILFYKGLRDGKIVPFDDNFYEKLRHTYINCLPVSIHIKYLKPVVPPGKCYDRSLYMFFCFENALLVRAGNKDLELKFGECNSGHGWIEMDNYVYDPSLLLRFDKDLYYKMYVPTNIKKYTKEDYCSILENKELYNNVINTQIDDYRPGGKRRCDLHAIIPLILEIAHIKNDMQFIKELYDWLSLIEYDEKQVHDEINQKIKSIKNAQ